MNETTKAQIEDLLRVNSMTSDVLDERTLTQLFLSQMRISLYGGKSSIPMLPTFLPPFGKLLENEPTAVVHIDDKDVTVFLVTFSGDKEAKILFKDSFPVPGREYPAPLEDLLYAAAELLEPIWEQARQAALCMPFPIEYDGNGDGCIRRFSGTMTVSDYEGKNILALLAEEMKNREKELLPTVLVSTPDAVLLSAALKQPTGTRSFGLVWGETIDMGFVAPGSIVLRRPGISGSLMLFDGSFSSAECVPFGQVDFSRDRDCYGPGLDLYLKMVSTDYLGDTFRLVMIKAAERKLLSFGCSRDILSLTWLSTEAMTEFLQEPEGGGTIAHFCREPEDRAVGLLLAKAVLERAARLVCANISAVLLFAGAGRDLSHPACIGLYGKAFDNEPLSALLKERLSAFTQKELGLSFVLSRETDGIAAGSAAAALYQKNAPL